MIRSPARYAPRSALAVFALACVILSTLAVLGARPSAALDSGPGTSTLTANQALAPGQSLHSPDGRFVLVMQGDGNLVLYSSIGALWSSRTAGYPGAFAVLQADGNLVVYGPGHVPRFASGTSGGPDTLVIQTDGNMVIYGPGGARWATDTVQPAPVIDGTTQLLPGQYLAPGGFLSSDQGRFVLVVQTDGNVVLYERGVPLFATGTSVPGDHLVMQGDGNLVVYAGNRPLWASSTSGAGASAVLQGDGNFVVYRGPRPLFATGTNQPNTGVGVYGSYSSYSDVVAAIGGGWPIVGDAGALGTRGPPYTAELPSQPDLNVARAIAAAGSPETWLSFWTVSGPVASDTWANDGFLAGRQAALTLNAYGAHPSFVVLDPEGFNGAPTTPATWAQFLGGWAGGIRSINGSLVPAFYSNQSEYQAGALATIALPAFVAISPIRFPWGATNQPLVAGDNIRGFIEYYAVCQGGAARADKAAVASHGALYNTVQFADSRVDCGA